MNIRKVYRFIHLELRIVGFIISMITTIVIFISFVVSPEDLEKGKVVLIPHRLSETFKHESCFLCGMTRSFAAISAGDFARAKRYNKFGPLLYGLFWTISLLGITLSVSHIVEPALSVAKCRFSKIDIKEFIERWVTKRFL